MDEGKRTLSFIYVLAYQMKNGSQQTYSTMSGEKNQYFSIWFLNTMMILAVDFYVLIIQAVNFLREFQGIS